MICSLISLTLVFIWDHKTRMSTLWRSGLMAAIFALIPVSYPLADDEPRYFHYLGGFNASAFFVSLLDLKDAATGSGIADRFANMPAALPFASPGACETAGPRRICSWF